MEYIKTFLLPLIGSTIGTCIPILGFYYLILGLYYKEQYNIKYKEKMDILYGDTSRRLIEASGIIYLDLKNEKVAIQGPVDVAREDFRNCLYRLDTFIKDLELTENDKTRILELWNGFKNIGLVSYTRQSDENFKNHSKDYKNNFLKSFPNIEKAINGIQNPN